MARTIDDLRQMQAMPLELKIRLTQARIRQWVNEFGEDGVYVSFSGGKDSTVLLHLVRELYPDIPAVFVNTGLEYPEIVQFVKTFENVEIMKPSMNFKKVVEKYGYPFLSKEISGAIHETKTFLKKIRCNKMNANGNETNSEFLIREYNQNTDFGYTHKMPVRVLQMIGKMPHKKKGVYTGEISQLYDKSKWLFLLDAPFDVSNICCHVMKRNPIKKYQKKSGRHFPFIATMAQESMQRQAKWLKEGCNAFKSKHPQSAPMSFWTEQDVLKYIKDNNIKIASVYGDIVPDEQRSEQIVGQLRLNLDGTIEETECVLKTTGCDRTGCMFCGFGCHLEKGEGRFARMKSTHPKQYEWIMKPWEEGGLNYKEVIDWLNENGGLNIRY